MRKILVSQPICCLFDFLDSRHLLDDFHKNSQAHAGFCYNLLGGVGLPRGGRGAQRQTHLNAPSSPNNFFCQKREIHCSSVSGRLDFHTLVCLEGAASSCMPLSRSARPRSPPSTNTAPERPLTEARCSDGYEWGYGGSGPAQTALAILLEATGDEQLSLRLYQHFKHQAIAQAPYHGWKIPIQALQQWIDANGNHPLTIE